MGTLYDIILYTVDLDLGLDLGFGRGLGLSLGVFIAVNTDLVSLMVLVLQTSVHSWLLRQVQVTSMAFLVLV